MINGNFSSIMIIEQKSFYVTLTKFTIFHEIANLSWNETSTYSSSFDEEIKHYIENIFKKYMTKNSDFDSSDLQTSYQFVTSFLNYFWFSHMNSKVVLIIRLIQISQSLNWDSNNTRVFYELKFYFSNHSLWYSTIR